MGETLIKNDLTWTWVPIFSANSTGRPWWYTKNNKKLLKIGTLVISARWTIWQVNLPNYSDFTCTQTTIAFVPNIKVAIPKYLYYAFKRIDFKSITKGVGIPMLTIWDLSEIEIPLPSLEEQKLIVSKLNKLAELIELKKETIGKTEELTKSVFLEMFGDPISNPREWKTWTFWDGISVLTDYHANGSYEILRDNVTLLSEPSYAYMVRTTDLESINYNNEVKYIDEHAYNFLSKTKIYGGEIIINKIWSAWAVYLMPFLDQKASLWMNAFLIRTKKDILTELFTFFYLKNDSIKKLIESKVMGAVTKTITKDAVRSIILYFPPYSLQQSFSEIVQKNQFIIEDQKQTLKKLQVLYNKTTQDIFTI